MTVWRIQVTITADNHGKPGGLAPTSAQIPAAVS